MKRSESGAVINRWADELLAGALPPNQGVELTAKSVTPFAGAKAAPLLSAAHPKCLGGTDRANQEFAH
jgi:hypothetical protein